MAERQLLQVILQYPDALLVDEVQLLPADAFTAPAHRAIWDAIVAAGGLAEATKFSARGWANAVASHAAPAVAELLPEIAVASLPVTLEAETGLPPERYADSLVHRVRDSVVSRKIADAMSALQRAGDDDQLARRLSETLTQLHRERAQLRAGME
ncbi:hypothetical protein [Ornithinimicrobium sp. INDO-MA30-4]|uniref:hypothetical protein n=1 Tax=Ornithinimicrobium sp. INDO-MA30-4 TaxID=2908651 RepID=UPI0028833B6F|nr:hypothetical protein [Ornithinimicrobium sp. INDO-MA30-4]